MTDELYEFLQNFFANGVKDDLSLEQKKKLNILKSNTFPTTAGNKKIRRFYKWQNIKEDIALINSLNPALVLDLGCGDTDYKQLIDNLIGIDIVPGPHVDIVGDFTNLEFEDNSVDAIIAYGSINFGDEDLITQQLQEAKRVLKDKGIICFRAWTGPKEFMFNWTEEKYYEFTKKFNFKQYQNCQTIYRLKRTGVINDKWRDIRSARFNGEISQGRVLTRLHWIWQK
jgi:SAM-dependent methyltransferase